MASALTAAIGAGVTKSATALTADLRAATADAGWSPRATSAVRVTTKDKTLAVTLTSAADAAEHGGVNDLPNPAVRRWLNKSKRVESIVVQSVAAHLAERGIL